MWITRDWICRMWSTEREGCRGGFGGLKEPAEYNGDWECSKPTRERLVAADLRAIYDTRDARGLRTVLK